MNKAELIEELAGRLDGNRRAAGHALESVLDVIQRALVSGEKVVITGFGSGVGGTGTYSVNTVSTFTLGSITITSDLQIAVPNATVYRFPSAGASGGQNVGVIKLTN